MTEDERAVRQLFAFNPASRVDVKEKETRFVHYTTADTAMKILTPSPPNGLRYMWMRNAQVMNDASEVSYGYDCLMRSFHDMDRGGGLLKTVIDNVHETLWHSIKCALDNERPHILPETYLLSISEHGGEQEDQLGRLSMWRAYGGPSGVAIVFRNDLFTTFGTPVLYGEEKFSIELNRIVSELNDNIELLKLVSIDFLRDQILEMFKIAILSTKHPGFHEEREWRIILSSLPTTDILEQEIVSVCGIPQLIYKLPLYNYPEYNYTAAIPNILDRIIIGPTPYPEPVTRAFWSLLRQAGIKPPQERVVTSYMPLRV